MQPLVAVFNPNRPYRTHHTMPPYTQTWKRILAALEAIDPHWNAVGQANPDNPPSVALVDALADAITSAPPEHLAEFVGGTQHPDAPALVQWAHEYTRQRDCPRFVSLLDALLCGTQPQAPRNDQEPVGQHPKLYLCAPPHHMADAVLGNTLPHATHVDARGRPVYSIEQLAWHLGKPAHQVHEYLESLHFQGLVDEAFLHTGPVYPLQ